MARPKLGLFGALFAIGSVLAWRWAQAQRDASKRGVRELHRWEDEGGKVVTPASASSVTPTAPVKPANGLGNGALGGTPEAWNFPHS
ncbi:hypothetical protein SBC1_09970 [Caballeronia sp. SBC1]|uniref:hypothetical protein n=1 Tax=unclassified Caballeronia TaxID=2646786 RepID=UPI0013E102B6|nr:MULTISPECIES: hypothetical protein [unclassified Caballeronia]QIE23119.1 hypothetical protein SBC2_11370 [Caballeronia sp. SBC2]QIN61013.1 hypothetical protein SBC1_09970 [Caballeronia sp. SBC1]